MECAGCSRHRPECQGSLRSRSNAWAARRTSVTLLHELKTLDYQHDAFRGRNLKRGYAQFGYSYVSTGRKLEMAAPMPSFLQEVLLKAQSIAGDGEPINQCIVTHYPANSGIGWHTDAPRFGECVIGVSLGGAARLQFRLAGGPARWQYQHQVVPVKQERYSLTFRHVPDPATGD